MILVVVITVFFGICICSLVSCMSGGGAFAMNNTENELDVTSWYQKDGKKIIIKSYPITITNAEEIQVYKPRSLEIKGKIGPHDVWVRDISAKGAYIIIPNVGDTSNLTLTMV